MASIPRNYIISISAQMLPYSHALVHIHKDMIAVVCVILTYDLTETLMYFNFDTPSILSLNCDYCSVLVSEVCCKKQLVLWVHSLKLSPSNLLKFLTLILTWSLLTSLHMWVLYLVLILHHILLVFFPMHSLNICALH